MNIEWIAGGWFGGQIGSTMWVLAADILSAIHNLPVGLLGSATLFISARWEKPSIDADE